MDFGKESMEHEFERNARTAEAEQSKRAVLPSAKDVCMTTDHVTLRKGVGQSSII